MPLGCVTMSIKKLSAGSGYEYLTRQVAAFDSTELGGTPLADYYSAKGEQPGRWVGSGLVGLGGVTAGDAVRSEQMGRLFGQGDHPVTGRQLGRAYRRGGVAGFDLTFSPVKSVSALWAVAPPDVARLIEQAHDAAVVEALAYVEREVLFTREGADGARQVETRGLVATAFRHRDSRAGDPDLHTHVAVANRVQTRPGKWLTIYGRVLYQHAVAISETYNTALERRMGEALGVEFAARPGSSREKRPVREIVGVEAALCRRWSLRRVSIVARRDELAAEFTRAHGRVPTAVEEIALAQRANLETRQPKHEARSEAEQRATWRREAAAALGSETVIARMVRTALNAQRRVPAQVASGWVTAVAAVVVRELEESRAVWQEAHIRAEILRQVRSVALSADQVEEVVERVSASIEPMLVNLTPERDPVAEPEDLPGMRRSDGTSVYRHTGSDHYTSPRILEAEARLVAAAGAVCDFGFTAEEIEVTLAACAVEGERLKRGQADLVRAMAGGGERLRLGLAPAGSGKTTAMRALARVWTDHGYGVVGLAPSAAAAAALREATGMFTETLAKIDYELSMYDTAAGDRKGPLARVGPGTLVVIDEAGMASTLVLDRVVGHCLARGAVVRLVGDDQQLAAVGAGGVLRDIATTHGVDRLEEVVRFTDPVEAQASLDLREGDHAALGFYVDHDRVHAGEETACLDAVFEAWVESTAAGEDCLMLAPTRELVGELNERARAARLAGLPAGHRHQLEVALADGARASVGDTVITRRNERRLAISGTDWVKNGDRWEVVGLCEAGMQVRHASSGLSTVLPPEYVAADVELGYASTVRTAQGVTADVMHGIVTGEESRQLVYTMLTRGRTANHVHVVIEHPDEAVAYGAADQMIPGLAEELDRAKVVDVLTGILGRDGSAVSATTTRLRGASAGTRLREAATGYTDTVTYAAQRLVGGEWEAALEAAGDGPLPWLAGIPADVVRHATWGPYLTARAHQVATLAEEVRSDFDPATVAWARRYRDVLGDLGGQVAPWRAATGVEDTDRRLLGPPVSDIRAGAYQRALRGRINANYGAVIKNWEQRVADVVGKYDDQTVEVAKLLDRAARQGHDVRAMLARATRGRPLPAANTTAALGYRLRRQLDGQPARRQASAVPGLERPSSGGSGIQL